MTRLRDNSRQDQDTQHSDWISLKKVSPIKIEENTWMLWASWSFILFLPLSMVVFAFFKLFI